MAALVQKLQEIDFKRNKSQPKWKLGKVYEQTVDRKEIQMAHNYMKIFLNYIHNKRMQLKTMKYHFHPLLLLSCFSRVRLLATPWTADHQAPPSMGTRLAKIQKFDHILYWQFWGNRHSHTAGGCINWYNSYRRHRSSAAAIPPSESILQKSLHRWE